MANEWTPIPDDKVLRPGDRIRLYYSTVGVTYITASQIALAEKKLEDEPRFEVLNHSYPVGGKFSQEFYFTIRITEPRPEEPKIQEAGIITVAVCSTIILGAMGAVIWVFFAGARQLEEAKRQVVEAIGEATEGLEVLGWSSWQIAAALIAVYLVYKYA